MQKTATMSKTVITRPGRNKRMKKIGLAMTEEMYARLDELKTIYFESTVPAVCRIALTRWLAIEKEERERKEKRERLAKEALERHD